MKSGANEQFDGAEYISSLREAVGKDITASGAKIISGEPTDDGGFYYEYSAGKTLGRIEISGKSVGDDYYSLKASLDEIGRREE